MKRTLALLMTTIFIVLQHVDAQTLNAKNSMVFTGARDWESFAKKERPAARQSSSLVGNGVKLVFSPLRWVVETSFFVFFGLFAEIVLVVVVVAVSVFFIARCLTCIVKPKKRQRKNL